MTKTKKTKSTYPSFDIEKARTETKAAESKIDRLCKDITKDYGEGIFKNANEVAKKTQKVISIGPALDIILGGGVPEGSWVISSGQPKCGKTTTALSFASNWQKLGRHVYYVDAEARLKKMNLEGNNLDLDNFTVIASTKEKILTSEELLDICERILRTEEECLLILDSASAFCAEKEMVGEYKAETRTSGAKLLAQFCRKNGSVVPLRNHVIWIVQHLIANTSGFGAAYREDGGQKIAYQVDVKIRAITHTPWKDGEIIVGQKVNWKCVTSALSIPNQQTESYIRYGMGIDRITELIILGTDIGLIEKGGSWLTCSFMPDYTKETKKDYQFQGNHQLYNHLTENPKWLDELEKQIKEIL